MSVDKLVDSTQLDADLTSVADAIRSKGGTDAALAFPAGFVGAIESLFGSETSFFTLATGTVTPVSDVTYIDIPLRNFGFIVYALVTIDPQEWDVEPYFKNAEYNTHVTTWYGQRFKSYWPCNAQDSNVMGYYQSGNDNGHSYKSNTATYTGSTNIRVVYASAKFSAGRTYHWVAVGVNGR